MHRDFRNKLDDSVGLADTVIAVMIDIRSFTEFSRDVESADITTYIKRFYARAIDDYFPGATFFKPTGDGLLLVFSYDKNTIVQKAREVISSCLKLHREFPKICRGDRMVNFPVPQKIGIGIARGSGSVLRNKTKILDYSGRSLNLASRLQELARPSGVIIDGAFEIEMLPKARRKLFSLETVYVAGIAEYSPIPVFVLKDVVVVAPENLRPLKGERIVTRTRSEKLANLSNNKYRFPLKEKPLDASRIEVTVLYPAYKNKVKQKGRIKIHKFLKFEYKEFGENHYIDMDDAWLREHLSKVYVQETDLLKFEVVFPARP